MYLTGVWSLSVNKQCLDEQLSKPFLDSVLIYIDGSGQEGRICEDPIGYVLSMVSALNTWHVLVTVCDSKLLTRSPDFSYSLLVHTLLTVTMPMLWIEMSFLPDSQSTLANGPHLYRITICPVGQDVLSNILTDYGYDNSGKEFSNWVNQSSTREAEPVLFIYLTYMYVHDICVYDICIYVYIYYRYVCMPYIYTYYIYVECVCIYKIITYFFLFLLTWLWGLDRQI